MAGPERLVTEPYREERRRSFEREREWERERPPRRRSVDRIHVRVRDRESEGYDEREWERRSVDYDRRDGGYERRIDYYR